MRKHLAAVRKRLSSADIETVQSGIEMVRDLNLEALNDVLTAGLEVAPITNGGDIFGRRNLCALTADSDAEVIKRVKPAHRAHVALSLLNLSGKLDSVVSITLNPYSQSFNLRKGFEGLSDASALNGLTDLEVIDLAGRPIRNLSELPKLRALSTTAVLSEEDDLSGFGSLEVLQGNQYTGADFTSLSLPASLKSLTFRSSCPSLTSLEGLEDLTKLEVLNLDICNALASLDGVRPCEELRYLSIGFGQYKDLDALAGLRKLETLYLSCKSLESIEGVLALVGLKTLQLKWTTMITDLHPFAKLVNLNRLHLGNSSSLVSLRGADRFPKLIDFSGYECGSLADIAPLLEGRDPERQMSVVEGVVSCPDFGALSLDFSRCTALPESLRFSFHSYQFADFLARLKDA